MFWNEYYYSFKDMSDQLPDLFQNMSDQLPDVILHVSGGSWVIKYLNGSEKSDHQEARKD